MTIQTGGGSESFVFEGYSPFSLLGAVRERRYSCACFGPMLAVWHGTSSKLDPLGSQNWRFGMNILTIWPFGTSSLAVWHGTPGNSDATAFKAPISMFPCSDPWSDCVDFKSSDCVLWQFGSLGRPLRFLSGQPQSKVRSALHEGTKMAVRHGTSLNFASF
jgi:hypothetical protein